MASIVYILHHVVPLLCATLAPWYWRYHISPFSYRMKNITCLKSISFLNNGKVVYTRRVDMFSSFDFSVGRIRIHSPRWPPHTGRASPCTEARGRHWRRCFWRYVHRNGVVWTNLQRVSKSVRKRMIVALWITLLCTWIISEWVYGHITKCCSLSLKTPKSLHTLLPDRS